MKKENYKANGTKCEQLVNLEEEYIVLCTVLATFL